MTETQYGNPNEQVVDENTAWVNGRIFYNTDATGRMHVVIMNTDTKKVADEFYAEPGDDGSDVFTSISALRSLTGERISEKDLKESRGMKRGKLVVFNTLTREMDLR